VPAFCVLGFEKRPSLQDMGLEPCKCLDLPLSFRWAPGLFEDRQEVLALQVGLFSSSLLSLQVLEGP